MLSADESKDLLEAIDLAEKEVNDTGTAGFYDGLRQAVKRETAIQTELPLTTREREVFDGLIMGVANKDIAASLHISVKTVDTHRGKVLKKLGLKGNVALIIWATQRGFVRYVQG